MFRNGKGVRVEHLAVLRRVMVKWVMGTREIRG